MKPIRYNSSKKRLLAMVLTALLLTSSAMAATKKTAKTPPGKKQTEAETTAKWEDEYAKLKSLPPALGDNEKKLAGKRWEMLKDVRHPGQPGTHRRVSILLGQSSQGERASGY